MARIDYIDDPSAPKANSVVPSVVAVVEDNDGRILMIHKTDNDLWALPGGGHDIGESIRDTVVREVREETGYDVEVTNIIGTYTNPNHVMAYDDGEVNSQSPSAPSWLAVLPARARKARKSLGSRPLTSTPCRSILQ